MSPISRWFRKKDESNARGHLPSNWERQLERLEADARQAPRAFQGTPLNRAGDLCLRAGDRARALDYYGRAIDVLLGDGQREAARGVANKIIRVHPEAVRTLATLTWLDLAARHMATALLHLRDYVDAAKRSNTQPITGQHVVTMASIVPHEEFLAAAADSLDQLGFVEKAARVREWMKAGGSPDAITDPGEMADYCLREAVAENAQRGRK